MTKALTSGEQRQHPPAGAQDAIDAVRRIVARGKNIGIEIPQALAEQQAQTVDILEQHDRFGAQLGYLLLAVRQQLDHGQWLGWLQDIGVHPRKAQQHIVVTKLLLALEDGATCETVSHVKRVSEDGAKCETVSHVKRVSQLPLRRKLLLAKLGPEAVQELIEDGDIERLAGMPEREFRAQVSLIANLQRKATRYKDRLGEREAELAALRGGADAPATPDCLRAAREGAPAIGGAVSAQLDRLNAIAHELLQGAGLAGQRQARREQLAAGAQPLHLTLMSIAAQALAYARALEHNFEGYLPAVTDATTPVPLLSAEEVDAVRRKQRELEATMDMAVRRATAPAPRPKRGRPKGSRTRARR